MGVRGCIGKSVTREMFASPLNVHPQTEHWAACGRDSYFGAHLNAYSQPWLGACLVNPEYEDAELAKAVQWALTAATAVAPTLLVLCLPRWTNKKYFAHLSDAPSHAHLLCTVPEGRFNFTPASYGESVRKSHHAHFEVDFWLVGNAAGLQSFTVSRSAR